MVMVALPGSAPAGICSVGPLAAETVPPVVPTVVETVAPVDLEPPQPAASAAHQNAGSHPGTKFFIDIV
jgi:hypothetical protein